MNPPRMRRRLDYSAPVLPLEYLLDDDPIWPCSDCLPWHVEVVHEDSDLVVREWHAVDCPALDPLDDEDDDDR